MKKKVKKEDYRRYGLEVPFYQNGVFYTFIFLLILAIDAVTLFNSIDLCFSNNSQIMSYIVTGSVCLVIDIIPLIIVDVLHITAKGRKIIPWIGMGVIFTVIAFLIFQRVISSDAMFTVEEVTSKYDTSFSTKAEPYQVVMSIIVGIIPVATSVFGVVYTIRRNSLKKRMSLIENKIELENLLSAKEELEKSADLYDILKEDEQLFENMRLTINDLYKQMLSDKNDIIALSLGDPESISYISALEYDDLFPINSQPAVSLTKSQPAQISVSMPLTQVSY